jgi:general secretion pathway protein I
LQVEPYAEPRTTTAPVATDVGGPTLAQITLQVRWGEGNGEQLQWRSLRVLPPVPGTPR